MALIGKYEKKSEKSSEKKEDKIKLIKKESWIEAELIRPLVAGKAGETAFSLFNTYKKAHGMASYIWLKS